MDLNSLLVLTGVHLLALATPGPDVFLVLRTSLAHGFKYSIYACLGVGFGIVLWVILTAFGLKSLFLLFPFIKTTLMVFSVCYLGYLSFLLLRSSFSKKVENFDTNYQKPLSTKHFFIVGFLTNLSNPKAILYFASIFSRFVSENASFYEVLTLVFVISFESILAFILLGRIFSIKRARELFLNNQNKIDAVCGVIFALFAMLIFYELILNFKVFYA
ncbi:LysE family translocator [Campylobacter mucosalis]|uniref:LysE family translocator n=1 Tax=Campylobacter mucosalis TaxID=202 RepID=UPI0014700128|nr:LysE family translocator [Campylobacter mucosalis]